jgi:hypothetical protein
MVDGKLANGTASGFLLLFRFLIEKKCDESSTNVLRGFPDMSSPNLE